MTDELRHMAVVPIGFKRLATLLLPKGAKIRGVLAPTLDRVEFATLLLVVEHPDLPEVREGDLLARKDVTHRVEWDGC